MHNCRKVAILAKDLKWGNTQDHFSSVRKQIFFSGPKGIQEGPSQQDLGTCYCELSQVQNNWEQVYPNSTGKDHHTMPKETNRTTTTTKLAIWASTFYPGHHWTTGPAPCRENAIVVPPVLPVPLLTDGPAHCEAGKKKQTKKKVWRRGNMHLIFNHQLGSETYG